VNPFDEHPLFYLLALGLFAAASYWLSVNSQNARPSRHADQAMPDYEATGFSLVTLGADGRPLRRIEGRRLRHFLADGRSEIIAPKLVSQTDDGPPWRARAQRGWLNGDGDLLFLSGVVSLRRDAGGEMPAFSLDTRDITLELTDQHLKTDAPVRIRYGASHVEALGMEAWFGTQERVKLLAQVRAIYPVDSL